MSVNTDAVLFYGIDLGEEDYAPWFDNEELLKHYGAEYPSDLSSYDVEWDKAIAFAHGIKDPDPLNDDNWDEHKVYLEKVKNFINQFGCFIDNHCSYSCPIYYIAIDGAGKSSCRGYSEEIKPEDLKIDPTWDEKLKKFCELIGVEYKQPKWLMVSLWGE